MRNRGESRMRGGDARVVGDWRRWGRPTRLREATAFLGVQRLLSSMTAPVPAALAESWLAAFDEECARASAVDYLTEVAARVFSGDPVRWRSC